jgi:hypothetical protein
MPRAGAPLLDNPAASPALQRRRPVALRTGLAAGVPSSEGERVTLCYIFSFSPRDAC